jgi:Flp pilus assembly protein TadG
MRSVRTRERGSSLAETAIIMAVVLAIIFGIVDCGRALYTYGFVAQLARQGARWAIVRGADCTLLSDCPNATSAELQTYVQSLNEGATTASSITATLSFAASAPVCTASNSDAPGCLAVVTVSYPFKFLLPFLPTAAITMQSTSEMVIAN